MVKANFKSCIVASGEGQKYIKLPFEKLNSPNIRNLKTLYSAVSFGSESSTISNKRNNLKKLTSKDFLRRGLEVIISNPFLVLKKIRNVVQSISPIGYSSINLDESTNKYVIAFGQYANHCSFISVPNGMTLDIENKNLKKSDLPLLSTAGILAIAINGCKGAIKHCERNNKNALIIGGGILGVMSFFYLNSLNYKVKISDPNKNSLSNLLGLNSSNSSNKNYSIIIDSSGTSDALLMYLSEVNNYSSICLLGESPFPKCKSILESKNSVVTFCNSFGSDRGVVDIEYNLSKVNKYPKYRSMQSNINDAYKLIINGELKILNKYIKFINPILNNFEYSMKNINIIDWTNI